MVNSLESKPEPISANSPTVQLIHKKSLQTELAFLLKAELLSYCLIVAKKTAGISKLPMNGVIIFKSDCGIES